MRDARPGNNMTDGALARGAALLDEIQTALVGYREIIANRELEMVGLPVRVGQDTHFRQKRPFMLGISDLQVSRVIDIPTGNKARWGFPSEDVNGLVGIVDTAQLITALPGSCCQGKIQGKFDRIPAGITNFAITDQGLPTGSARSFSEREGEFTMEKIVQPSCFEGERTNKDPGGAKDISLLCGERVRGCAGGIRHRIRKADRKQPAFSPKKLYPTSGKHRDGKIMWRLASTGGISGEVALLLCDSDGRK